MEADGREALGRSRGGLTCKIHLLADDRARPLVWQTSPGQRGDNPMLIPVLEELRIGRRGPGRPRTRPDRLRGDKTPHAAIGSSGCGEWRGSWWGECDRFVEPLVGGQAVVELAEHAVEEVPESCVVAIAVLPSAVVVVVCAG